MAKDMFFIDEEGKFYRRKGGNKIEPLGGFRVLSPNGQRKHPILIFELRGMGMTSDGKGVLFYGPDGRVFTTRTLRQDHTFLPPKVPDGCYAEPITGTLPARKRARKKKRPRR